jgi:hypothetical protein
VVALMALVATFVLEGLGRSSRRYGASPGALRVALFVAAGSFLGVESWEFAASGELHGHAVWAVLGLGALFQVVVVPLVLRGEQWSRAEVGLLARRCAPRPPVRIVSARLVGRHEPWSVGTSAHTVRSDSRAPPFGRNESLPSLHPAVRGA